MVLMFAYWIGCMLLFDGDSIYLPPRIRYINSLDLRLIYSLSARKLFYIECWIRKQGNNKWRNDVYCITVFYAWHFVCMCEHVSIRLLCYIYKLSIITGEKKKKCIHTLTRDMIYPPSWSYPICDVPKSSEYLYMRKQMCAKMKKGTHCRDIHLHANTCRETETNQL